MLADLLATVRIGRVVGDGLDDADIFGETKVMHGLLMGEAHHMVSTLDHARMMSI